MIRFAGYWLIAEKPRVGQLGRVFPCTLYEKLCVGSKNEWHLFDGHDELYHLAKFGEDRTTRAGCRCEMVFVFFSRSVTLRRPARCSFEGDKLWTDVVSRFIGRFWYYLHHLFQHWLPFQMHYVVRIIVARWRHKFREIAFKNFEKSKDRRKSMCARLRIDSWEILRKFHCSGLGPRM